MRYELHHLTAWVGMDEQMQRVSAQGVHTHRHQRARRERRQTSAPLFEPLLLSGFS